MSLSVFEHKEVMPNNDSLTKALGDTKALWDSVMNDTSDKYGNVSSEWKYYSKSSGWTFVVKSGKRTLLYLIPMNGYFKANFVYGGGAVEEALSSDVPENVKKTISGARQYIEGRSFMTDVKKSDDVDVVIKLTDIKNRN
jgi:hypothetical protein